MTSTTTTAPTLAADERDPGYQVGPWAARVIIDESAWGDLRFVVLAYLLGLADAHHALTRCARIWSWQTRHFTDEAPTYEIPYQVALVFLGPRGVDALVKSKLAELRLDGKLYMRGSRGRIEGRYRSRVSGSRGGARSAAKRAAKGTP